MTLLDILNDLFSGRDSYQELKGGLRLQYRQPDHQNDTHRLLTYRIETDPGETEMVTIRQHIEKLLPAGTAIYLGPVFYYDGSDGLKRHCRVFWWQTMPAATQTQMTLLPDSSDQDGNHVHQTYRE